VQVCNRTNSRTRPYVTLRIPRESLAGYLRRGATVGPCVYGSVTRAGAVSLRTGTGQVITRLEARRLYSVVVKDVSRTENFHVFGPGVDKRTQLVFQGTVRWKLRFATGRYHYRSDAHPQLQRFFTARVQGSTN
jgi:hypothetical protein